ncbi:unnamed protein product [Prunus brigantina]
MGLLQLTSCVSLLLPSHMASQFHCHLVDICMSLYYGIRLIQLFSQEVLLVIKVYFWFFFVLVNLCQLLI